MQKNQISSYPSKKNIEPCDEADADQFKNSHARSSFNNVSDYLNPFNKYNALFTESEVQWFTWPTAILMIICVVSTCLLTYIFGKVALESENLPWNVNNYPIVTGLSTFLIIWFYFFKVYENEKTKTWFLYYKEWTETVSKTVVENIKKTMEKDYKNEKPKKLKEYLELQTENGFYFKISALNIIITTLVIVYCAFKTPKGSWINASVTQAFWSGSIIWIYLIFLTYWYYTLQTFADKSITKDHHIFSNFSIIVLIFNAILIITTISVFITFLFYKSKETGWVDFVIFFVCLFIVFLFAEGDTAEKKYENLLKYQKNYFQYLPSLSLYILFFVSYFLENEKTPEIKSPGLLKKYLDKFTSSQKKLLNNIYYYVGFPIFLLLGLYLFYKATTVPIPSEKPIQYNAIRSRYFIVYFLFIVYILTIYQNKTKIPCYLQSIFNAKTKETKALVYWFFALLFSGFFFLIFLMKSPDAMNTTDKAAGPKSVSSSEIFQTGNTPTWYRIGIVVAVIIVIIIARGLFINQPQGIVVFKSGIFYRYVILLLILIVLLIIAEFFNNNFSDKSDRKITSLIYNIFYFLTGTTFCIAVIYISYLLILRTPPGSNIPFYILFFLIVFVIFKIIMSTATIQERPAYQIAIKFIFLIPCLLDEYILPALMGKTYYDQYKKIKFNSPYVYMPIIIILAIFYIFQKYIINNLYGVNVMYDGFLLYNGPFQMRNFQDFQLGTITSFSELMEKTKPLVVDSSSNAQLYNYGIMFWYYLDNVNSGGTLIDFASSPIVNFNPNKKCLDLIFSDDGNDKKKIIQIPVTFQKWNMIFINIQNTFVDVFLNGDLLESSGANKLIQNFSNAITIGQQSGGPYGEICNFVFYPHPLSSLHITAIYQFFKHKTPPINTIGEQIKKSKIESKLANAESRITAIESDFKCDYQPLFEDISINHIQIDDDYQLFDRNYLSLQWYFNRE